MDLFKDLMFNKAPEKGMKKEDPMQVTKNNQGVT